jgi:hypothetical protein
LSDKTATPNDGVTAWTVVADPPPLSSRFLSGSWSSLVHVVTGWPWLILYVALFVRLWGITWQLPALMYRDELKYEGWAGAVADNRGPDSTDFRNPSLFRHMLLLEYRLVKAVEPGASVRDEAVRRTTLARLTSAVLGAGAAVLTGLAAARLFGPFEGAIAGLVLAIGPLPVHLSHIGVNDAPALFFLTAGLYFGARAFVQRRSEILLLAGITAGLATAAKYNFGVVGVMPLLAAAVYATQRRMRLSGALILVSLTLLAGLAGLLVAMPEIATSTAAVRDGFLEQTAKGREASVGQQDTPVLMLYVEASARGLGLPAIVFALLGTVRLVMTDRLRALALLPCPVIYLIVMLSSERFAARFALPLMPFAAILTAVGIQTVRSLWRSWWIREAATALCIAAIVLPSIVAVIQHDVLATTRDTRLLARDWLKDHADGVNVAVQTYGLPTEYWGRDSGGDYRLRWFQSLESPAMANRLACEGNRYVVLSNFWSERDVKSAAIGGGPTGYDWLRQHGSLSETISPFRDGLVAPAHVDDTAIPFWFMSAYARPGPRIEIWQLPDDARSLCVDRPRSS